MQDRLGGLNRYTGDGAKQKIKTVPIILLTIFHHIMYPYKYYRYVNLPKIPVDIVKGINWNIDSYESHSPNPDSYKWSDSFNKDINEWCQKNICDEIYWAFQIIRTDLIIHRDIGTKTKFNYLIDTGGDKVTTNFYDEDQTTLVDSVVFEPERWHILKADSYHQVLGVVPGRIRLAVTGRIF